DDHIPGLDHAILDCLHAVGHVLEHAGRAGELFRPRPVANAKANDSAGGEVAVQYRNGRTGADRILDRTDDLGAGDLVAGKVGSQRVAGAGHDRRVDAALEPLEHRAGAAGILERFDAHFAGRTYGGDYRYVTQIFPHRKDIEAVFGLGGGRLEVFDRVDRTRDGEYRGDGVAERTSRQDVARLEIFVHHFDDASCGLSRIGLHFWAIGAHWRVAGQAHAERLDHRVHCVGGCHPRADARAHDRILGHVLDGELGRPAEAFADRPAPHVFDVDRFAVDFARWLVPADDKDSGYVEAGRGHQVTRRGLVAARQAYHPVEQRRLDLDLDVVGDDVAAGKDITAALGGAGDEVARGG